MLALLEEIQEDINWRVSEISNLKTIPVRYKLLEPHKKSVMMYSIPAMYALWEGFLKYSFELLTKHLNNLNLDYKSIHINIVTHAIENKCNLGNERKYFDKKIKLVNLLSQFYDSPLKIEQGIPNESNANFKVTNRILERFNIQPIEIKYEKPLDRLLLFRNKIAHGENSIKVTRNDIDEFSILIESLMYEILLHIEEYLKKSSYYK